jgi:hypothetical protein
MINISNLIISPYLKKLYRRLLFIAVIICILYYIIYNIDDISKFNYKLNWIYLFFSVLFFIIAYLIQLFIWIRLAKSFGLFAPFFLSAKAWSLSQLGKYIPGKIGLFLVRIETYENASKKTVAIATGVEFITSISAACILILIALAFLPESIPVYIRWISIIFAVLSLIALYPPLLGKISRFIFKILKRELLIELPTFGLLLKLVAANVLVGLPYGLGLFFAFNCFYSVGWNYFLTITGVYYAAALVGLAALFAPAGIGVREGIAFLILPVFIAKQAVIFGTILTRIIITFVEILLAVSFVVIEYFYSKKIVSHKLFSR